jgi:hypothetical protein
MDPFGSLMKYSDVCTRKHTQHNLYNTLDSGLHLSLQLIQKPITLKFYGLNIFIIVMPTLLGWLIESLCNLDSAKVTCRCRNMYELCKTCYGLCVFVGYFDCAVYLTGEQILAKRVDVLCDYP